MSFNRIVSTPEIDQKNLMSDERKRGWSFGEGLLLGLLLFMIAGFFAPWLASMKHRSRGGPDQTEAVNNARQLGIALFEFQTDYGSFPDETTAAILRQEKGTQLNLGNSSANDYFRQLMAAQIVASDRLFYAKTAYSKRPNKPAELGQWTLEPGTVGFGYLMNGKLAFTTEGNPLRPLACTPLAFDGKTVSKQQFDPDRYADKAVVLRIDNSAMSYRIDKKTKRMVFNDGKHLLQTGPDTIWGSHEHPVIIPPLPRP